MPYHRRSIISYHLEIKVRSLKMNQWAYLWRKDDWSWQLYGTSTARNKFPASQRQYFSDCVTDAAVTPQATQKDRKFFFKFTKVFFLLKWKFFSLEKRNGSNFFWIVRFRFDVRLTVKDEIFWDRTFQSQKSNTVVGAFFNSCRLLNALG